MSDEFPQVARISQRLLEEDEEEEEEESLPRGRGRRDSEYNGAAFPLLSELVCHNICGVSTFISIALSLSLAAELQRRLFNGQKKGTIGRWDGDVSLPLNRNYFDL